MQIANVLLSIGGDHGNQVSKRGVTAAEVAVLRQLHGEDAVTDIEPAGDVQRTHRNERLRLLEVYGRRDATGKHVAPVVEALFPGAAARVFETLEELELPENLFRAGVIEGGAEARPRARKASGRKPAAKAPQTVDDENAKAPQPVDDESTGGSDADGDDDGDADDDGDGVGDMPNEHGNSVLG